MHTRTFILSHMHTHAHSHAHSLTHSLTCTLSAHTFTLTCTHSYSFTLTCTCSHSFTHVHTRSQSLICTHSLSHAHSCTCIHTHVHTRSHSHAYTCSLLCTHTHTWVMRPLDPFRPQGTYVGLLPPHTHTHCWSSTRQPSVHRCPVLPPAACVGWTTDPRRARRVCDPHRTVRQVAAPYTPARA